MVRWRLPRFSHHEAAKRPTAEATLIAISLLSRYGTEMIAYWACMNPSVSLLSARCLLALACKNSFDLPPSRKAWIHECWKRFLENYLRTDHFRQTVGQHGGLFQGYSSRLGHQPGNQPSWESDWMRWQPCEVDWVETSHPFREQPYQSWLFCIILMKAANHSAMTSVKIDWSRSECFIVGM